MKFTLVAGARQSFMKTTPIIEVTRQDAPNLFIKPFSEDFNQSLALHLWQKKAAERTANNLIEIYLL